MVAVVNVVQVFVPSLKKCRCLTCHYYKAANIETEGQFVHPNLLTTPEISNVFVGFGFVLKKKK
jgi:hypothetical protein